MMLNEDKIMIKDLVFFDFDYTLAKTSECIWIQSPRGTREFNGKWYRVVNPIEYNVMILGDDEKIDENSFKEFDYLDSENARPIPTTLMLLQKFLNDDSSKVFIITARKQLVESYVFEYLKLQGIKNYQKIEFKGLNSSDPFHKFREFNFYASTYCPENIYVFDDSKKVIDCFEERKNEISCSTISCLVENKRNKVNLLFTY